MPEYEDDGSEGDSGEEDSMANFMGAEERVGHSPAGIDEADDSAGNGIVHENDEVQYQSGSEQENGESGSEREESDGSAIGEEETAECTTGRKFDDEDGFEYEGEESGAVPERSFQGGRSLRTMGSTKEVFPSDSREVSKDSDDEDVQEAETGVPFSKEASESEAEEYVDSSDKEDSEEAAREDGMIEDVRPKDDADAEVDECKEDEIDGEVEEKDSDDDYEVNENGDDDGSEFKVDEAETPSRSIIGKQGRKPRYSGVRTNLVNGAYAPSLSKIVHYEPPPQEEDEEVEEEEQEEEEEEEDDDEEEEEADDPDDVDFAPVIRSRSRGQSKVSHDFDESEEEQDDEFEDDESLGLSDDSDDGYKKIQTRRKGRSTRGQQQPRQVKDKVTRERRSTRTQRNVSYSEASESEAKDTDEDPDDEEYGRRQRKPGLALGRSSRHETATSSSAVARTRREKSADAMETRTSRRQVPRKSYAEAEESEDEEGDRSKKRTKVIAEDGEEEDGDAIEKVLWHQPRGIAEAEAEEGRKAEPFVLDTDPQAPLDWDEQEFYIKWKGQSYLHCQWQYLSDLSQLSGYKKVVNYMKKIEDDRSIRRTMSPEEAELHDVSKEMELDLLKQYVQVERVFASRTSKSEADDDEVQEYLVKWKGLSYGESTWEKDTDIAFALEAIDEYKAREASCSVQGKLVDSQRRKNKSTLRKLETQPEWLKGGTLRDYQLEGLNFLMISWRNDTNVILADEMGLGKTVQSVSMLGFLQYSQQIHGPFLVVVPLSTITNWAKEFRKWLPEMNVVVYVGNRASREMCQKYEFPSGRKSGRTIKFDTLLTTYEVVLKDKTVLEKVKWTYLMVDEAHRLKNSEAALYQTLSEFNAKNKCLVTGTPLQNSVEELWALLHFLDAEKFRSKEDFTEKYKNLNSFDDKELANLHGELRPHLLRRVIKDVEKSLPPKIERILRVEMSPLQKRYYKWILERNFQDLNKGVRGNNQVSLLNIVVELKKCCNHPFLFISAEHAYGGGDASHEVNKVENIVLSSGKLTILDKLLIRLKETKHRVLIFSQMVKMLDILADYLSLRGFQYQRLDGSTRADLRQQAMEHFNAPGSEDFCFLLSTRAGGLGINLATADTVIIFDSDWNPQNDLQAMSRAHRIGQQDVVNIYRFVTSRSVEEDILERAKKKMVLDHLVIQKLNAQGRLEKKEAKKGNTMFDKKELAAILRFGAEELFKEDESEGKSKLENMDIDEILARAEKVEAKEGETEGESNELLSAFKVANFSSAEDDATFWSRLIPPEAALQAQEETTQRAARNVRTYAEDTTVERNSRKRRATDSKDRPSKRATKAADVVPQSVPLEGAAARVCTWDAGNLSKKDANAFVRVVKKFGDSTRMKMITKECGGAVEGAENAMQLQLFNNLVNGCKQAVKTAGLESKVAVLDFFGVPVKAQEVLARVKELAVLAKRVKRYSDPFTQFRLKSHPRNPTWSKACGWNQVDDARLLLGVHYHGLGNWEKIRTDDRLGLSDKIAPAGMSAAETSLPRATHLDARATALLRKELEDAQEANGAGVHDRTKRERVGAKRERGDNHGRHDTKDRHGKPGPGHTRNPFINSSAGVTRERVRAPKEEVPVKEEGEISDADNTPQPRRGRKNLVDKDTKESKWHEWCAQMMHDQQRTLKSLEKLQTAYDLSKEEALHRVKKYLKLLGRKVDEILKDNADARNLERMAGRLWSYVSTFSSMSGERLSELYKKLKEAPVSTSGGHPQSTAGPSGHETDRNHHGGPNHESRARPSGKQQAFLEGPNAESNYRDNERDRGDGDAWQQQHYRDDQDRESDAWQRRQRDDRLGVEGGGMPGQGGLLYSGVSDRRKWEGRPGSSEGWDRGVLRPPPGVHGAPFGPVANGANGWAYDPRNRAGGGRGPMDRDRKWHGDDVLIHHGRGGAARGL